MSKTIAVVALFALMTLSSLGNYWFTFGLWPKSWWSFFGFFWIGVALHFMLQAVNKER